LAEELSVHIHPAVEAFFVNDAEVVALIHADNVNAQLGIQIARSASYKRH
jgi:hypothetical protein